MIGPLVFGFDFRLTVFITIFRAQYSLPPNVISYLDRSFTKKALKNLQEKSISRTKKVNYPIRSEVIKFIKIDTNNSPAPAKVLENVWKNKELKKVPGYSGYRLPGGGTQEPILDETFINALEIPVLIPRSPKVLEYVHKNNQEFKKVPGYSGYRLPGYGTQEPILDNETFYVDSKSSEWEGCRNFVIVEKNSEKNSSNTADQNQIQIHVKNEFHHEIKIEDVALISNDPLKIENDFDFDGQFNFESNPLIKIEEIE